MIEVKWLSEREIKATTTNMVAWRTYGRKLTPEERKKAEASLKRKLKRES